MALLYHFTGQDYTSRGLIKTTLQKGSTSTIVGGCRTGSGWEFDGTVNSALYMPDNLNHDEFTITMWVYVGGTGNQTLVADGTHSYGNRINIRRNSNGYFLINMRYADSPQNFVEVARLTELNTWYFACMKLANGKLSLSLNEGNETVDNVTKELQVMSGGLYFGKRLNNQFFNGQICNFKYYDHALSKHEIHEDFKALILHYPLNKAITDTVLDVSGFKRHITNLTNNTVTLDSKAQVYSASLKNDGTQALVGTSDLTDLNGIPELSISFRVYKRITNIRAILTNRTIAGEGISIFILKTEIYVDVSSRKIHSYTLPLNEWVNICITQSATEQKLYANGVLVSTMTASTLTGIGNYTSISNSNIGGELIHNKLNGNVQDIRFYATALTANDVRQLYESRMLVDSNANVYTYELIEGSSTTIGIDKYGQMHCNELIENEDGTFSIKSDKTIKVNSFKEI